MHMFMFVNVVHSHLLCALCVCVVFRAMLSEELLTELSEGVGVVCMNVCLMYVCMYNTHKYDYV